MPASKLAPACPPHPGDGSRLRAWRVGERLFVDLKGLAYRVSQSDTMPSVSELGGVIAQMRAQVPPVPYRQIAAQLGISVGKVQRELARATVGGEPAGPGPAPVFDPEVSDSRRRLEMGRLELAQQRLGLDRMELEQRMSLLQSASTGKAGDNGPMLAYLVGELARLRESTARPPAGGGIIDELSRFREVGEIVKAMAPAPVLSGRDGVEMQVALERIRAENERIFRERQAELDMKRVEVEGQAARDHSLAKLIEGLAPVAAQAAQTWIERQAKPAPAPMVPMLEASGSAAAPAGPSGLGHCPRCNYPPGDQEMELVPTGGPDDRCPGCSAALIVVEGRIALAGTAPRQAPAGAAPVASNGHGSAPPTFTS
jgi:hypothetical protein